MKKLMTVLALVFVLTACSGESADATPPVVDSGNASVVEDTSVNENTGGLYFDEDPEVIKRREAEGYTKGEDGKWHKYEYLEAPSLPKYIPWDENSEILDVNPEDYFISDQEYDLVGFMANFGFTLYAFDKEKAWFNRMDGVEIIVLTDEDFQDEFVGMTIRQLGTAHPVAQEWDFGKGDESSNYVHMTGDLSEMTPFNASNLIRALREMPKICRNIRDKRCPFHGTVLINHFVTDENVIMGGGKGSDWHSTESVIIPERCY